ncbi:MAG: DUF169 domain-containing protein [Marinifilaceae bacterium]|nr:DUF169 domain-containing protein [Marinifilaceae bacterium]
MDSIIVKKLKPSLKTSVILKSDVKSEYDIQAQKGKYFCIMSLFAQVVKKSKTVVLDRETYGCPGACAGLGFGTAYDKALGGYETFASFFSKGIESALNKKEYEDISRKMPAGVCEKLLKGERFHSSKEKALKWIKQDIPIFNFPEKYRIIKPLEKLNEGEIPESVIFTVNALELTALMTLVGSITEGVNQTITPQGAACQMIGNFVFEQSKKENPKAVLGLIDLAARHTILNQLPNDIFTYSVSWDMFLEMENEAKVGIFESPLWTNFTR